jgi:hypothetical protein
VGREGGREGGREMVDSLLTEQILLFGNALMFSMFRVSTYLHTVGALSMIKRPTGVSGLQTPGRNFHITLLPLRAPQTLRILDL